MMTGIESDSKTAADKVDAQQSSEDAKWNKRYQVLSELISTLTGSQTTQTARETAAKTLVGYLVEKGINSEDNEPWGLEALEDMSILENVMAAVQYDQGGSSHYARQGGLVALYWIFKTVGKPLEPVALTLLPAILERLADKKPTVRQQAMLVAKEIVQWTSPLGAPMILPILFQVALGTQYKMLTQQGAVALMREVIPKCTEQLYHMLPEQVMPPLSECICSIEPQVSEEAIETMIQMCGVIDNPDVEKVLPLVVKCIGDPSQVPATIEQVAQTTFVRTVGAPLLSVMIPLLARGLADRANLVKRRSSLIIDNMCRLVPDAKDILKFMPDVVPGLERIVDIGGDPDMVSVAARALITLYRVSGQQVPQELEEASNYDASRPVIASLSHTTTARDLEKMRLETRLETVKQRQEKREKELDQLVAEMNVTSPTEEGKQEKKKTILTPWVIYDLVMDAVCQQKSASLKPLNLKHKMTLGLMKHVAQLVEIALKYDMYESDEWEDHYVVPYISYLVGDATVAKTISDALLTKASELTGHEQESKEQEDGVDYLADCQFSLGYGAMVLLRKARMRLKRGSRYGLCGQNGCGKSTLLAAISKGQVDGFPTPDKVKSVLVAHDFASSNDQTSILDVLAQDEALTSISRDSISHGLSELGFTDVMISQPVNALSGGWKMKLGLARAMLMKADILLLDEPTNHLDQTNVNWLIQYLISLSQVTSLIISHDTHFLDQVCDHIIHYERKKLKTYKGNLSEFVKVKPEAKSYYTLSHAPTKFIFPKPGSLDGVSSKNKPVLRLKNVEFAYPGAKEPSLKGVSGSCCLASRIAVIGPNGAGKKDDLIRVLTGEMVPQSGQVWKHPTVRVTYVAQHPLEYLDQHLDKTPNEYVQWRFQNGEDKELALKQSRKLSKEEEEQMQKDIVGKNGESRRIEQLVGRSKLKKSFQYEVKWVGMNEKWNTWVPRETLEEWGFTKLCQAFDDKASGREGLSGFGTKELTQNSIQQHFEDFGLEPQFSTHGKIRGLSGGQKIKTVLASAMWGNPHMLILDEPTNYLDRESLAAFAEAIKAFEGGVVIISHHSEFVSHLCNEFWYMNKGVLTLGGKIAATEDDDDKTELDDTASQGSSETQSVSSSTDKIIVSQEDLNQKGPLGGKKVGKHGAKPMTRKQKKELEYKAERDRLIALGIMPE